MVFLASIGLAMIAVSSYWFIYLERFVTTDDAYIETDLFPVNARIMGYVKEVLVEEGTPVKKGDLIAAIDDSDLQFELNFKKMKLQKANADLARAKSLKESNAISAYDLENAEANYRANLADMQTTEIKLKYTRILAPASGVIAKKNLQPGQFVQPGQSLAILVDNQRPWIKANFKETQIESLKAGQVVRVVVDGYPKAKVIGRLETIFPSSGAKLSILPPENATGNFTRIVQRIPVKIRLEKSSEVELRPGMSAQVTVDIESDSAHVAVR